MRSVEFDPRTETYRTEFDHTTRPPSEAIVTAVAHARDRDPLDLPQLQQTVDTDALDSIFARTVEGPARSDGSVTFTYDGFTVTVKRHGTVEVKPTG